MNELNDKKIEILLVAERLFADQGFDGTSIRDIAAAAQINIAMISYYFGSKEKLLEALVLYRIEAITLQLENLLQEDVSPFEKMDRIVAFYIKRIYANQKIHLILQSELTTKKRNINLETFAQAKMQNFKILQSIVVEGQQKGVFRPDVNSVLIIPTIIGTLVQMLINKSMYQEILGLESDSAFENYVLTSLTEHIQKTIKALLTYEN